MNSKHSERTRFVNNQRGQAMMEYTVVCGVLAFILLYPIKDVESPDQARTTVQIVLDGFRTAYQRFSYAISIPT